jgi:hypothetical protein
MLGVTYLARFANPMTAYNRLQTTLMKRFFRRGGTRDEWVIRLAPAYRERYGWMCKEPVAVKARRYNN